MKISTKGRYGIRFMLDLAAQDPLKNIPLNDIAKRQEISEKYLWQVLVPLKTGRLIEVTRGAAGGYRLARALKDISVMEILNALEGGFFNVDDEDDPSLAKNPAEQVSRELWKTLSAKLSEAMERITLADLVERQKELSTSEADFVI